MNLASLKSTNTTLRENKYTLGLSNDKAAFKIYYHCMRLIRNIHNAKKITEKKRANSGLYFIVNIKRVQ